MSSQNSKACFFPKYRFIKNYGYHQQKNPQNFSLLFFLSFEVVTNVQIITRRLYGAPCTGLLIKDETLMST